MSDTVFFGYGSLVNVDTFPEPWALTPSRLTGWRRSWSNIAETPEGPVISLSIHATPGAEIDGILLRPRNPAEQAWLDARESGYEKIEIARGDLCLDEAAEPASGAARFATYRSLSETRPMEAVINLSYIDAVLQGFLRFFGEAGAQRFVETTDGWDAPIENDRAAPRYPRAVTLSAEEAAFIDALLQFAGAHPYLGALR